MMEVTCPVVPNPTSLPVRTLVLGLAALAATSTLTLAESRKSPLEPGKSSNWVPSGGPTGFSVHTNATAAELIGCLLGSDVTVSNVVMNGAPLAYGTFTGGGAVLGFDAGIILSTGNPASIAGPNQFDNTSTALNQPGDANLDALLTGTSTLDATVLEFDFSCATAQQISFQYVFASEEYNEYVNDVYNDVFAFFLNGNAVANNIATVPAYCAAPGIPVTINNVNCNNPFNPPTGSNCGCYRNNDLQDGGGAIDTEMDGLTVTFVATAAINPGVNHIKLAIADAGDDVWDSNVMIRCQSFICGSVPTLPSTWGRIKTLLD